MDEEAITSQLTSYDKFVHTLSQVDKPQNRLLCCSGGATKGTGHEGEMGGS